MRKRECVCVCVCVCAQDCPRCRLMEGTDAVRVFPPGHAAIDVDEKRG